MGNPAARAGDMHICPMVTPGVPPIPHVGGPILPPGCPNVLVGGMPAARVGDMATCVGPPDTIMMGSTNVLIGGMPAARMGDITMHGGSIVIGLPTVLIGGTTFSALRPISAGTPGFFKNLWNKFLGLFGIEPSPPPIIYGPFEINYDPNHPDFQAKALASLIRLDNTGTMHSAFNDIEASGHKVELYHYNPNNPGYVGPNNATCTPNGWNAQKRGKGSGSSVAWNPDMHAYGAQENQKPGSDVVLGHELIHASHNATGNQGNTPLYDQNGKYKGNMEEERNTVGLNPSVYNNPQGWTGGPTSGSVLSDTTSPASVANNGYGDYTENQLRQELGQQGYVNPDTGRAPVQRPSYGSLF